MRLRLLPLALFLLTSFAARADTVGLTSVAGGSAFTEVNLNEHDVIGWQFTTSAAITVTELGLYNPASYGYALTVSHQVGLWSSLGVLLASATVSPTGTTIDSSYFTAVTPVDLAAGKTYTLGALFTGVDRYVSSTSARTTSPGITYLQGVYVASNTLVDPGSSGPTTNGRFGPNFEYTATTVTPEPSSLMLLGTGLLGAMGLARRRLNV